jgi:hypothetical protein
MLSAAGTPGAGEAFHSWVLVAERLHGKSKPGVEVDGIVVGLGMDYCGITLSEGFLDQAAADAYLPVRSFDRDCSQDPLTGFACRENADATSVFVSIDCHQADAVHHCGGDQAGHLRSVSRIAEYRP